MEKSFLPIDINGNKIQLKKLSVELAPIMFKYVDEDRDRLSFFLPWPPYIIKVEDEIEFIKNSSEKWDRYEAANFGIFRSVDNEYMGNIGVFNLDWKNESCEIGYWILGKFEGNGYMRESVMFLERELFNLGFNRIVIKCEDENGRSRAIPNSLNFVFEGKLRDFSKDNNRYVSLEVYSKLKKEYLNTIEGI
jgi:RimJ/RimL family protein N-acetyltransferase